MKRLKLSDEIIQRISNCSDGESDAKRTSGVYEIRNIVSGKRYIGASKQIEYRWRKHTEALRGKRHGNIHLQRSWDKHGEGAFEFAVLLECEPLEMIRYEQVFLDTDKPEYNMALEAFIPPSCKGITLTREHKEKIGRANKGKTASENHRKNLSKALIEWHSKNRHPLAKLTKKQVLEIRDLYSTGDYTQTRLGKLYGVDKSNIYNIVRRKTWKGV